jgi:RND family efflux transporter MFP subunit
MLGPQFGRIAFRAALMSAAAALVACSGDDADKAAPSALPALQTVVVAADGAAATRHWDGVVEAVRDATLSAQTGGRVAAVAVDVNDRVAAGQTLLRLTVVEQQAGVDAARAQLRAAEAAAAEAERQYRRFAALAEQKYVSRAQVDQARAARDSALAARDAARAHVAAAGQGAAYTVVRAPYAGIVSARMVEPGETIAPGQPLLAMYAPEDLRIELRLPQSAAEAVRAAPGARVRFDDGRSVDAREVVVYPSADPVAHSIAVRVLLPRMEAPVAPGSSARVAFASAAPAAKPTDAPATDDPAAQPVSTPGTAAGRRLRIPNSAVLRRGELTGAYVLQDGRLYLRQLRLGERESEGASAQVEVLSGLKPGDAVVRDPLAAVAALAAQRRAAVDHDGRSP